MKTVDDAPNECNWKHGTSRVKGGVHSEGVGIFSMQRKEACERMEVGWEKGVRNGGRGRRLVSSRPCESREALRGRLTLAQWNAVLGN